MSCIGSDARLLCSFAHPPPSLLWVLPDFGQMQIEFYRAKSLVREETGGNVVHLNPYHGCGDHFRFSLIVKLPQYLRYAALQLVIDPPHQLVWSIDFLYVGFDPLVFNH